jgi:Ca-activated chloride channel family protein
VRYHQDLWPRLVGAAIALMLVDLLVRRVRLFDRKHTARPSTTSSSGNAADGRRGRRVRPGEAAA